ncbi:MAG: LysM peptidoglycan-binding domain-containing protein [Chthoniobacterales bacterium]
MKSSTPKRRTRTLRAKASAINPSEFEDYGPEPNMKLSHAFMVVLALHIVAVGGLFAFNKMKVSHASLSLKSKAEHILTKESIVSKSASQDTVTAAVGSIQETGSKVSKTIASHQQAQALMAPTVGVSENSASANHIAPGATENPPPPSTSSAAAMATSTPEEATAASPTVALQEYTIVKGDNPYKVAKKFHVSYDALVKLNNITDPRKIQIGQKLKIPAKKQVSNKQVKSNG